MKKLYLIGSAIALLTSWGSLASAQCSGQDGCLASKIWSNVNAVGKNVENGYPCDASCTNFTDGNTDVNCSRTPSGYPMLHESIYFAAHDHFTPSRHYTYSRLGINAARIDKWNDVMGKSRPWHGDYNYWRWNRPTALVVPPTAVFQSSYSWGVGQTRSLPINHQFGRTDPGGGSSEGLFSSPPYWPSSTNQSGVYPVRASW
jgi:hypothetical protein